MQMDMKREIDYANANRIQVHSRAKHVLTAEIRKPPLLF